MSTVDESSGIALITTGKRGENSIVVVPAANARLTSEVVEKAAPILERAGMILAQLEIPLETVEYLAQFANTRGIPLMLDPAPARDLPESLLRRITWLTPNETEAHALLANGADIQDSTSEHAARRFLDRGVKNVILKLGSRGCLIAQPGQDDLRVPAFSVAAVDTTAAGDAFNGGFAVALMRGLDVRRSATFASAVAAISVTRSGAQPSMPTAEETDLFLKAHSAHVSNESRNSPSSSRRDSRP